MFFIDFVIISLIIVYLCCCSNIIILDKCLIIKYNLVLLEARIITKYTINNMVNNKNESFPYMLLYFYTDNHDYNL